MPTVTLTYNGRNKLAQEALDNLLTLGFFKKRTHIPKSRRPKSGADLTHTPNARLRKAIEEAERGELIHCGSFENYLRMTRNV
jgi:hypothetical protein